MSLTNACYFKDIGEQMEMVGKVIQELFEVQVVFNFCFEKSYDHIPGNSRLRLWGFLEVSMVI